MRSRIQLSHGRALELAGPLVEQRLPLFPADAERMADLVHDGPGDLILSDAAKVLGVELDTTVPHAVPFVGFVGASDRVAALRECA